jgi:hypothetical protein
MAIKDIFTMIKADRYTQDGREELIKAQEAVTEDVTYKPGDISRKTGLQKQPDGSWAPVKNAPAQSKKMDKAKQSELAKRGETVTKMSDLVAQKSRPDSAPSGRQPTPEMLEREKMRQSPEAKARRDKFDSEHPRTETGAPKFETEQENAQYARGLEGWDDVNPDRLPDIKKKVEQKIDYYKNYNPYAMLGKKTGLTAAQKSAVQQNIAQAKENLAFYTGQLEGISKKMGGGSNDSAPRILTGDCKIRIKKA